MSNLKTKPILTIGDNDAVGHPSGEFNKQITADDLKRYPERYLRLFPTFYANRAELEHELNTRSSNEGEKALGKKNVLKRSKASNGVVYNVIVGSPKKKSKPAQAAKAKEAEGSKGDGGDGGGAGDEDPDGDKD